MKSQSQIYTHHSAADVPSTISEVITIPTRHQSLPLTSSNVAEAPLHPPISTRDAPTESPASRIPISVISIGSMVCRICQTNNSQEPLISPCHCKGSMAYVHLSCLERWLNQSSRNYCELCMYHFNAVQSRRYKFVEGIKLWMRHPRNRAHIQSDLLIAFLLTIITVGLLVVCAFGLQYFVLEARKLGLSRAWTKSSLVGFMTVIVLGYTVTMYLLIRDQILPWYTWWTHTVDVKLLISPSVLAGIAKQVSKDEKLAVKTTAPTAPIEPLFVHTKVPDPSPDTITISSISTSIQSPIHYRPSDTPFIPLYHPQPIVVPPILAPDITV